MNIIATLHKSKFILRSSYSISGCFDMILPQNHPPVASPARHVSTVSTANGQSFVVSYLVNSCGLSPESALSASNTICFTSTKKPDLVVSLLKSNGLSNPQVARIIELYPSVLCCSLEKTLLPKIEFFYSKGLSRSDISQLLAKTPLVLCFSLRKSIIPGFDFLKSLFGCDQKVISILKNNSRILCHAHQSSIASNVCFLEQFGVPRPNILYGLMNWPCMYTSRMEQFRRLANEVKQTGFNISKVSFMVALSVKSSLRKETLEIKHKTYMQWGLSKEELLSAFLRSPAIMKVSTGKIGDVMDLLVNEMELEPSNFVRYPEVICMSLKNRLIPRCSVIKFLWLNGLVCKKISFHNVFYSTEKVFLQKFVSCFQKEGPLLSKLYQEAFIGD